MAGSFNPWLLPMLKIRQGSGSPLRVFAIAPGR
jgi:kynurenine formamidase